MHHRSSISVYKFLSKHLFARSTTKPISSFPSRTLTNTLSNQCSSSPNYIINNRSHHFHSTTKFPTSRHTMMMMMMMMMFRRCSSNRVDVDKEVDNINLKFAEAREEIESAMESKETVYFNEEAECAREAVAEVLQLYEGLLNKVSENERGVIQRSMGLKIEQLKAEVGQLDE